MNRQERRAAAKHLVNDPASQAALEAIQNAQEPSELDRSMANFRMAVEYQQFMSEVLNHVQQSMVQIPEDHRVYISAVEEWKPTVEEAYFRARERVMEFGMSAAEHLNPENDGGSSIIVVPEVTP